ncbi:collagen alpha-1(I) chain-like [Pipistrellus kuhlii]|uniref:collagen alpha-1(I) chain-like n=1 Tax=Pipistrellus kuhlii TaxID=59472 RepID=UPI001E271C2F|nr:collagen alpha-1(I) chain-like [Pipistrellus kuhlii]
MYYGITPHKTFIQKPYQESTSQLYKHMQRNGEEREASEVRHPLCYTDDQPGELEIRLRGTRRRPVTAPRPPAAPPAPHTHLDPAATRCLRALSGDWASGGLRRLHPAAARRLHSSILGAGSTLQTAVHFLFENTGERKGEREPRVGGVAGEARAGGGGEGARGAAGGVASARLAMDGFSFFLRMEFLGVEQVEEASSPYSTPQQGLEDQDTKNLISSSVRDTPRTPERGRPLGTLQKEEVTVLWATIPRPYSSPSPRTGSQPRSRSRVPTPPNKLEADLTGTQPGAAAAGWVHLRASGSLRPAPGAGRGLTSRPTRRRGEQREAFPGKFKGSPSAHRARQARPEPPPPGGLGGAAPGCPRPSDWAEGGAGARARRGRREAARPPRPQGPPPRRPPLPQPKAEQPPGPAGPEAGAQPGPDRRPLRPFPPPPLGPRRRGQDACALGRGSHLRGPAPARERGAPTLGDSPGSSAAEPGLGGGGRRRHHLRWPLHRDAAGARGALDPTPAAPPAAATWKRGGGAGAPRAAAAAASGAAAHDSVTGGIRQSVTWTPGPCGRRCSGANRGRRAPPLARPQPMGRARASM